MGLDNACASTDGQQQGHLHHEQQQPDPEPADHGSMEGVRDAQGSTTAKFFAVLPIVLSSTRRRHESYWYKERCLRVVSNALRDLHDAHVFRLNLGSVYNDLREVPPAEVVEAVVRGVVARGGRPAQVAVALPTSCLQDPTAAEQRTLALLTNVAAPASATCLELGLHTPITPAVATAAANLGPNLDSLHVQSPQTDGSQQPQRLGADVLGSSGGAELLLRLLGPRLKELHLWPAVGPNWPIQSLRGLSNCTALVQLQLMFVVRVSPVEENGGGGGNSVIDGGEAVAAEESVLRTLSALSTLRSLYLSGGVYPPPGPARRAAMAPGLQDCLSRLTGLTSLRLGLHRLQHYADLDMDNYRQDAQPDAPRLDDTLLELEEEGRLGEAMQLRAAVAAEWRAVAAAAACMPLLKELRTPMQVDVADLQALTALTCLRAGIFTLPAVAAGVAAGVAARRRTYTLSSHLRRLESHMPLPPAVVAALQPPSPSEPDGKPPCSLLAGGRLWGWPDMTWCFTLDSDLADNDARLTTAAVSDIIAATEVLRGFSFRLNAVEEHYRGMLVRARSRDERLVLPPPPPTPEQPVANAAAAASAAAAAAGGGGSGHFGAWLSTLVAAVRPEALSLEGLALAPRDLLGLPRCLPQLQVLDLVGCTYAVSSLSLLAGLRELTYLRVGTGDWQWDAGADVPDVWSGSTRRAAVESAFLALTAPVAGVVTGAAGSGAGVGAIAPLPALRQLVVDFTDSTDEGGMPGVEWLEGALAAAQEELGSRQGNGMTPTLEIRLD